MEAAVTALFDEATNTVSYIVADPPMAKAAIVDCVLDFNPKSARTSTCSADRLIEAVRRQDLEVEWIPAAGPGGRMDSGDTRPRRPSIDAIVGGLLVSQVLALFTTPVVYIYLDHL